MIQYLGKVTTLMLVHNNGCVEKSVCALILPLVFQTCSPLWEDFLNRAAKLHSSLK